MPDDVNFQIGETQIKILKSPVDIDFTPTDVKLSHRTEEDEIYVPAPRKSYQYDNDVILLTP